MMRWLAPCLVSLALVFGQSPGAALAEGQRPLPRPAAVEAKVAAAAAFAGASALAPRVSLRPLRPTGAGSPAPMPLPAAVPRRAATGPWSAPDPIAGPPVVLARAMPAALPDLGETRSVTLSAANPAPVFVQVALAVPRPPSRPAAEPAVLVQPAAPAAAVPGMRPRARPEAVPAAFRAAPAAPAAGALTSPRPAPRPRNLAARATPRAPKQAPEVVQLAAAPRIRPGDSLVTPRPGKGGVCGDPAIQGAVLPPITGAVAGCGIANPVRVTAVDGVRLSVPATLDCDTARALRAWVTQGLRPAAGKAGVAEIRIAAHYACRPRNNVRGARISEHGRGKAIDIAGIRLGNGQMLSVLSDYRRSDLLKKVRRAACGIFGTTLGPGSDRFHADHFHFDTARHRNGPYCR